MELIIAIALLCQVAGGSTDTTGIQLIQNKCQADLAACVLVQSKDPKVKSDTMALFHCINK